MDVITGDSSKSKFRLVGRFSPHSNPDYKPQSGESELNTVIATDVLSEGLNMQDCDTIINYDLHWNPVRLIQRFGRIDRIGSTHDKVLGMNFLPETKLDEHLHLRERLGTGIKEIQDTIGEDSAILDPTEKVNQEAMYAIYDDKPTNLDLFEPEEPMGLGEAEGILRQLRADDPGGVRPHRFAARRIALWHGFADAWNLCVLPSGGLSATLLRGSEGRDRDARRIDDSGQDQMYAVHAHRSSSG